MWKLVEADDGYLTDSELIGISVLLTNCSQDPHDDYNVYWRARQKIQPAVKKAFKNEEA